MVGSTLGKLGLFLFKNPLIVVRHGVPKFRIVSFFRHSRENGNGGLESFRMVSPTKKGLRFLVHPTVNDYSLQVGIQSQKQPCQKQHEQE